MKRVLLLAVCAIGMASCSKKSDNNVTPLHKPVVTISKDPAAQGDHTVPTGTEFGAKNVVLLQFVITTDRAIRIKKLPATFDGTVQLSNIEGPIRVVDQVGAPLSSVNASNSSVIDLALADGINIPAGTTHVGVLVNMDHVGTDSFLRVSITEDNVRSMEVEGLTAKDFTGSVQGPTIKFAK